MTLAAATAPMRTPLHALHLELGAKMVPFAGYDMPVHYRAGILAEHLHTRAQAGLFDVSHMGQMRLLGPDAATALEALVPGDLLAMAPMQMRYTLLLNEAGGIIDDLMATRLADGLFLVVNAARKAVDLDHLRERLGNAAAVEPLADQALFALQGPAAAAVLSRFADGIARLPFMTAAEVALDGRCCLVTRSGYTGEDGFEISLPAADAVALAERLLAEPEVAPIGLGARDSLRLEAGLCLWGHDIDEVDNPCRGGSRLEHWQEAAGWGRLSRCCDRSAPTRRGDGAQARRHSPGRPRPGPRRYADRRSRRQRHRPGDERRLWPVGRRPGGDGLCRGGPGRARHGPLTPRARPPTAGPCGAAALCSAPLLPRLSRRRKRR